MFTGFGKVSIMDVWRGLNALLNAITSKLLKKVVAEVILKCGNVHNLKYCKYYGNFIRFIKFSSRTISPQESSPWIIATKEKCLKEKLPTPQKSKNTPWRIAPSPNISPGNNCSHSSKFSSKSTTSELRETIYCLQVL